MNLICITFWQGRTEKLFRVRRLSRYQGTMPNTFAYVVLFSWPLVVWFLFRVLPVAQALAWSVVGGYLLIPTRVGVDFPMLPTLDKTLVPSLAAGIFAVSAVRRERNASRLAERRGTETGRNNDLATRQSRGGVAVKLLIGLLVVSPFFTGLTNAEPLLFGPRFLKGIELYDSFSMVLGSLTMILPFLLARRYLASSESHLILLRILVFAALVYSLPVLFEVRMSPQLNTWIYGFFPHSFAQHMRDGGFRPVVFLEHGLRLSLFLGMAVLAAIGTWRALKNGPRGHFMLSAFWLLMTLILSKSLGAAAITFLLVPVVLFLGVRGQLIVAALVACLVLSYPFLRGAGVIPVDRVAALALSIDEERASSLNTRLENEDRLLAKAAMKPVFGWGGWGRGRVYDADSGRDLSITDGYWVIVIGERGWAGYIAIFGLLTLPLILFALRHKALLATAATSGLAIVLAANLLDLIPNSGITPVTWLVAGALAGRYEVIPVLGPKKKRSADRRQKSDFATAPDVSSQFDTDDKRAPVQRRRPAYSRQTRG